MEFGGMKLPWKSGGEVPGPWQRQGAQKAVEINPGCRLALGLAQPSLLLVAPYLLEARPSPWKL